VFFGAAQIVEFGKRKKQAKSMLGHGNLTQNNGVTVVA
jgi:hypothetical protein